MNYLYTGSLFFFIVFTGVFIGISVTDIINQSIKFKPTNDYRNLIAVGASYVLLTVLIIVISIHRLFTVRNVLKRIPKLYIPIKKKDVPKKLSEKIQLEFNHVKEIRELAAPRLKDIQAVGWGKPGTPLFDGVDFKQAIARTPTLIEKVAREKNPAFTRPKCLPIRRYIEYLIQNQLVNHQSALFFLEAYEVAKFSKDPLSQEQYIEVMKHLAALLHNMGYQLPQTTDESNEGTSKRVPKATLNENHVQLNIYELLTQH